MAQNGKVVIDPSLYDLARVEVLRGPQGTLYGAGSMGGTIKLITNAPDTRSFAGAAEGIVAGTQSGGLSHTINGMLNVPLSTDTAALRLVLTDKTVAGWIDREVISPYPLEVNNSTTRGGVNAAPVITNHKDANRERLQAARASLLMEPTERLSIIGSFFYQKIRHDAPNTIW